MLSTAPPLAHKCKCQRGGSRWGDPGPRGCRLLALFGSATCDERTRPRRRASARPNAHPSSGGVRRRRRGVRPTEAARRRVEARSAYILRLLDRCLGNTERVIVAARRETSKMPENATQGLDTDAEQERRERREFLRRCGRFAVVTPPALTMLLSVSSVPGEAHASTIGHHRGNDQGDDNNSQG